MKFGNAFKKIQHKYPTRYSVNNFERPKTTKTTHFAVFSCWLYIWNNYFEYYEKSVLALPLFLKILKSKLLESENELFFFSNTLCEFERCIYVYFLALYYLNSFSFPFYNFLPFKLLRVCQF